MPIKQQIRFYAKEKQDKWVLDILNNKANGYFVDIGAHDGIKQSNTYTLEEYYGWTGICVEPHFWSFQELIKNRKCICNNLCIWNSNTSVPFVQRGRRKQISGIYYPEASHFILDAAEKHNHPIIEKDAITLMHLLKIHNAPKNIDYLSLDIEGAEWPVLSCFDFQQYEFLTITVEHNCTKKYDCPKHYEEHKNNIKELLTSNGYFLNATVDDVEDWYSRWPNT